MAEKSTWKNSTHRPFFLPFDLDVNKRSGKGGEAATG